MPAPTPQTFRDVLRSHADLRPDKHALLWSSSASGEAVPRTYAELDEGARALAAVLLDRGVYGKTVVLLHPSGLPFVEALAGCFYAGAIAVPLVLPRSEAFIRKIKASILDSGAQLILTTRELLPGLKKLCSSDPELAELELLAVDAIDRKDADAFRPPPLAAEAPAFLQYTSGSTSTPKGVVVTHAALIANERQLERAFEHSAESVIVTWLPLFHDMGLIGNLLQSLYVGAQLVLMSPLGFIQEPARWLQLISKYRAHTSGGPNFAYDACVSRVDDALVDALDLSSWRLAFNGSEPVRARTLAAFSKKFSRVGFRAATHYPCYGLAEACVFASGGAVPAEAVVLGLDASELDAGRAVLAENQRELVGCGRAVLDQEIRVVHPETREPLPDLGVGEVWLAGPHIAAGYWKRPEATAETFRATTATGEGPYLRTGDLGFLREGELFITGRLKDLIIVRGKNHYPQDIELTVADFSPAFRENACAAFTVEVDGEERLVVVQELEKGAHKSVDLAQVRVGVAHAIAGIHEVEVADVVLVARGIVPKTSSGKIQRSTCRAMYRGGQLTQVDGAACALVRTSTAEVSEAPSNAAVTDAAGSHEAAREPRQEPKPERSRDELRAFIAERVARHAKLALERIDIWSPFRVYGLDSAAAVRITGELQAWMGKKLSPTLVYEYPCIGALAAHLCGDPPSPGKGELRAVDPEEPIAVVSLACRFPGANTPEEFWDNLVAGRDLVGPPPSSRARLLGAHANVREGGFLDRIEEFDADFFEITPREAVHIDPQQRLLLTVAWEALERAGIVTERVRGSRGGVFVGISNSDYTRLGLEANTAGAYSAVGGALSVAANRLSYALDWRGPSLAIDTACSSSLVAVHAACKSLRAGECDQALAGGVNLVLGEAISDGLDAAGMLAPGQRCRTFDEKADGYVRGEGCGVVVLKRYGDAVRDGNPILALIRGSAVNQDGRSNGLTAPHGPSQVDVILEALERAGVEPRQVGYFEAHGTGTPLGDPIEARALHEVLRGQSQAQPCFVGSVKTNIGHLESAAGIAGFIKTVLMLRNECIPPHLHLEQVNAHAPVNRFPLQVARTAMPWLYSAEPRFAGVSSFGFGGTNAHVVLQDVHPPLRLGEGGADAAQGYLPPLLLSARTEESLRQLALQHASALRRSSHPLESWACATSALRSSFAERLSIAASSPEEAAARLEAFATTGATTVPGATSGVTEHRRMARSAKVAFLFSGQGSQYAGMGQKLHRVDSVFRGALDRAARVLDRELPRPLLEVMGIEGEPSDGADGLLEETEFTQPALVALQLALVEMWKARGVVPDYVVGHSVGEISAAYAAGALDYESALRLAVVRGRVVQRATPAGRMVALFTSEGRARQLAEPFGDQLALASVNSSAEVVLSGSEALVAELCRVALAEGVDHRVLRVRKAFHSPHMAEAVSELQEAAGRMSWQRPSVTFVSAVTARVETHALQSPTYWVEQLRSPVRFGDALTELQRLGARVFLELGPSEHLAQFVRRDASEACTGHSSLRRGRPDDAHLANTVGELFLRGVDARHGAGASHASDLAHEIPTYSFARTEHWNFAIAEGTRRAVSRGNLLSSVSEYRLPTTAAHPHTAAWEFELDASVLPFVEHHRIQDVQVVPGVVYLQMALAAARDRFGDARRVQVGAFEYKRALFLPPGTTRRVQVCLTGANTPSPRVTVSSADGGGWTTHAEGSIEVSSRDAAGATSVSGEQNGRRGESRAL